MKLDDALNDVHYIRELVSRGTPKVFWWSQGMIFFGLFLIVGCVCNIEFHPMVANVIWQVLEVIAILYLLYITRRTTGRGSVSPPLLRKLNQLVWVLALVFCLISNLYVRSMTTLPTFLSLEIGIIPLLVGLFVGKELLGIGVWIIIAAIVSDFITSRMAYNAWVSVASGLVLVFYGIWLHARGTKSVSN